MSRDPGYGRKHEFHALAELMSTRTGFRVVGLCEVSTPEADKVHGVDAWTGDGESIGIRGRYCSDYREDKLRQYQGEFTIRYSRPSGAATEWHKMPQYVLYSWFEEKGDTEPLCWVLINIDFILSLDHGRDLLLDKNQRLFTNKDRKKSQFAVFAMDDFRECLTPAEFRKAFIFSRGHPYMERAA